MSIFRPTASLAVIPAQAGIQFVGLIAVNNNQMNNLDSRLRGNDGFILVALNSHPLRP
jgi:hypothetical protein